MYRCEAHQWPHVALCRSFYCSPRVVANYSLKWNCSYSHMKPSAQIRHKSHSLPFCLLNHFPGWVPRFWCSANMLTCFQFPFFLPLFLSAVKEIQDHEAACSSFITFEMVQIEHMFLGLEYHFYYFNTASAWLSRVDACAPALHIVDFLMQIGMNK